ncbi:L-type lectin-domain containing receptor kinase IV.1-like [Coffea arabica]|uniref:L-type lectin-domain containing receptor kinase IV.1-like n=1 Tax=Coffea arabica TaxID=13443 RepID=A0ABM4X7H2_COFAR
MAAASDHVGFIYQGFQRSNLSLDGLAKITNNGLLQITNTTRLQTGHAFYPNPINFKSTSNSPAFSFSTQFVFAMVPDVPGIPGAGMAFVIAPTRDLPGGPSTKFLGLFNESTNGNRTNHVFAVELDNHQNKEFGDINDNHVGIDINSLNSTVSRPASHQDNNKNSFDNLNLSSGKRMQVWVEYDGVDGRIDVTLAPIAAAKPNTPLLSLSCDLSPILQQTMYVGFSASTSPIDIGIAYFVLGWSFKMNAFGVAYYLRRKWKFAEVLEEWELAYGPHRFKYKDIYIATKGFTEKQLLGEGGFGQVYKGVLQTNMSEVAVKKVSHQARQGMRGFIAEIVSIGRLRHRNLVPLLGYCRCKGELLLVYEFMPNGSLDKFLYNQPKYILNWSQRFRVIKEPTFRPSTRQVLLYLEGSVALPDLSSLAVGVSAVGLGFAHPDFEEITSSLATSTDKSFSHSVVDSILSSGR